jgi:hypothetical protein
MAQKDDKNNGNKNIDYYFSKKQKVDDERDSGVGYDLESTKYSQHDANSMYHNVSITYAAADLSTRLSRHSSFNNEEQPPPVPPRPWSPVGGLEINNNSSFRTTTAVTTTDNDTSLQRITICSSANNDANHMVLSDEKNNMMDYNSSPQQMDIFAEEMDKFGSVGLGSVVPILRLLDSTSKHRSAPTNLEDVSTDTNNESTTTSTTSSATLK